MTNLQVGDTVGDYEILGELGAGGMGKVFRVRNLISDRVDAMKVLRPDMMANAGMSDRFLREIKLHASLVHPNIASLHTALRHGDCYLMVMEFVEGRSLDAAIRGGPLDPAAGVGIILQVLAALSYAHRQGVIHRDIKPANILLKDDGVVKVTDFGIARSAAAPRLTNTGTLLGSVHYMSPEQIQALPVDPRSDLYSVGVTLYEALTGRRPFEGANEYEIMRGHLESTPAPPAQLAARIAPDLSQAILRALAKDPAQRFQTALEFRAALGPQTLRADALPGPAPAANADDLTSIQTKLLPYLGPITPKLVAQAASRVTSRAMLVRDLAAHIPGLQDREAFLKACQSHSAGSEAGSHPSSETPQRANWDPEYLQKVKQTLARYLGPVAGVLVDRTSKRVASRQQLCEALVTHIPSEQDRAKFLESVLR